MFVADLLIAIGSSVESTPRSEPQGSFVIVLVDWIESIDHHTHMHPRYILSTPFVYIYYI